MEKVDISVVAQVTERCNLECKYCYIGVSSGKDMSINTAKNLISKFLDYNDSFAHFTWIGGEPLLRDISFFESIMNLSHKYNYKKLSVSHSIQTNGVFLTLEKRNILRKMGFKISVSYDGCSEINDQQRVTTNNKSISLKVLRNIEESQKEVGIITVLTKKSLGKEKEIYDMLRKKTKFARINLYSPIGRGMNHINELLPSPEEAKQMMIKFYELWKNDDSELQLKPYTEIIKSFFTGLPLNCEYSAVSCYRILGVNVQGDLYICSRAFNIPHMKLGNINKHNLEDLINTKTHQQILERYLYLKDKLKDPWFFLSSGGCPVEAYLYTGNIMNESYYGKEVRNVLFNKIKEDLEDENTRRNLERKIGIIS